MAADDNNLAAIVSNNIWMANGCGIVRWIEENLPTDRYRLRFQKTTTGELVMGKPVRIEFDTVEAATMFKLTWSRCPDVY